MQRNEMRRSEGASFINVAVILCCISVLGMLSVLLPKPRYSEMEKRDLASAPRLSESALLTGEYTRELSAFYADSFPGRDRLVASAGILQAAAGFAYDGLTLHQGSEPVLPPEPAEPQSQVVPIAPAESSSQPEESQQPQSEPEPEPEPDTPSSSSQAEQSGAVEAEEDIAPERAGAIIIYNGKGYQLFGGLESMGAEYANSINAYEQALGDQVQIYNLVIPSAIAFGLPEKHQGMTTPERPRIENIYNRLNDGIISVNVYDSFEARRDEYLYFGTDHHWTVYGAHLAYSDFIRAAGMQPIPLEQMEKRTLGYDFFGTYYSQTQDSKLRRYPDRVDYFMIDTPHTATFYQRGSPYYGSSMNILAEYAQGVNGYSVFLHGDFPLIRIVTENKNGRRIAMVKESFGNAFAPFLVNHYEEVYVVDGRYLEVGLIDLIRNNGINELLFINNIFAAHTSYHINRLRTIMYQSFSPPQTQAQPELDTDGNEGADIQPDTTPAQEQEQEQPTQGDAIGGGDGA